MSGIAVPVALYFRTPVMLIALGAGPAGFAAVSVPVTAVHENDLSPRTENQVWLSGEIATV